MPMLPVPQSTVSTKFLTEDPSRCGRVQVKRGSGCGDIPAPPRPCESGPLREDEEDLLPVSAKGFGTAAIADCVFQAMSI